MSIDFDSLDTFDDWSGALKKLLDQAAASIRSGDIAERVEAQRQLDDFTLESPNAIAAELDDIARKAIDDIFSATSDEALKSIASRSAELARHTKIIGGIAKQAQNAAKSIRLESAVKAIGTATQMIRDLHELKNVLSSAPDDLLVSAAIDKAVKAVQQVVPAVMAVKPEAVPPD